MTEILLKAIHSIHDNIAGNFEQSTAVDPTTGDLKLRAVARITEPGQTNLFPLEEARILIDQGAARVLSEVECALLKRDRTADEQLLVEEAERRAEATRQNEERTQAHHMQGGNRHGG